MANEDPAYLAWLRRQKCQAPLHVCSGRIVAHHPTHLRRTGHGARKAHDRYGVTLCTFAHDTLHSLAANGPFEGYRRPDVRAFCEEAFTANRARYEGHAAPGVSLSALAVEVRDL